MQREQRGRGTKSNQRVIHGRADGSLKKGKWLESEMWTKNLSETSISGSFTALPPTNSAKMLMCRKLSALAPHSLEAGSSS